MKKTLAIIMVMLSVAGGILATQLTSGNIWLGVATILVFFAMLIALSAVYLNGSEK